MNKIVRKEQFSEKVFLFEIEAPLIAKSRKAGNFVIVRVDKKGEIKVTYNGTGKFPGHFKKSITVITNGVVEKTRLYIEGNMEEAK